MKAKILNLIIALAISAGIITAAPLGTAFTYQGKLAIGGTPANGSYDLKLTLCDAASGSAQVGAALTNAATGVTNGLFTVTLDFGAGVFTGPARWLAIEVRTNGGVSFTPLVPRQPVTPTPYALYAPSAGVAATATTAQGVSASAVTGAGIASGQVVKSLNGLKDIVALAAGPNVSLATNANTLTISAAGGGASGGWTTTGNAGTTPAANFLGTTDGQPLVINAGSVGINTNDPQATLHVNGTVLATRFSGDGSGLVNVPATLATPFTLTNLATTNSGGHARGLAISGRYAYVAQGYAGLHVYDISDPTHPIHVGPATDLTGGATAVALSGQHAFVAGDTLYCVDISSPANLVIVGFVPGNHTYYGVAVSGNVAYVAADADGLFTYNIANPANPVSLGHIDNGGNALGVTVVGNFAYLANDLDGLRIYDVANPAVPVAVGHINEGGHARGIAVSGDFAYLANDAEGLRIYNISDPANPVSVAQVADLGYAFGVAISGRHAFVANNDQGLKVYDISDPAHPAGVAVAPISDAGVALAVAVAGSYAYTANESGGLATYFAAPLTTVPGVVGATGFMGDGSSLTNLNAAQLTGQLAPSVASGLWQVAGNAGTTPGQSFLGTTDNQPLEFKVNGQRALRLEPNAESPNVIGGYAGNVVSNGFFGATIGGGGSLDYPNRVGGSFSTVVGGQGNAASGNDSTAMGYRTTASGNYSTAMGYYTTASGGNSSAIGLLTTASGDSSTTMGYVTRASGSVSTAMGSYTSASGNQATAMGNYTTANGNNSSALGLGTIASGDQATAMGRSTSASGSDSFAAGSNTVASGQASFAMGINAQATNTGAVALGFGSIAGGRNSTAIGFDTIADDWGATALGQASWAGGVRSTAMGHETRASGYTSTAMGFDTTASGEYSTAIGASTTASGNVSAAMGWRTVAGGDYSTAMGLFTKAGGYASTAMGDHSDATATYTMAVGRRAKAIHQGAFVWADSLAADFSSTTNNQFLVRAAGGVGINKTNPANALDVNGTIAAGNFTLSGPPYGDLKLRDDAFHGLGWYGAGKLFAGLDVNGAALYGNAGGVLGSVGGGVTNIALRWDASGKVGIGKNNPATALDVNGIVTATAFNPSSDRNAKEQFAPVNPMEVLDKVAALPISRWNFKGDAATPHVGPMAQDFHAAFGVGTDDKHIATVDADGVALAAIQGLNQKLENRSQESEVRSQKLEAENSELKQQLAELKALVESLAGKVNGGAR